MSCLKFLACITSAIFLLYTTAVSIAVLFSDQWLTSSNSTLSDIGIAFPVSDTFSWSDLTTDSQKACAGLLIAAFICGCLALFFLAFAILCFCCLLRAGAAVAGFFAFLQFASLTAAVIVFASIWDWSVPTGYSMGAAYISAIVAIPLALLASLLAGVHHSQHRNDDKL